MGSLSSPPPTPLSPENHPAGDSHIFASFCGHGAPNWSTCATLLDPRLDFACAACDGKIYVASGHCVLSRGRGTSTAEAYDPMQDRWDPLPNMSTLRFKCVGVTWQGRFYAVGGFAAREDSAGDGRCRRWWRGVPEVFDGERGERELMPNMCRQIRLSQLKCITKKKGKIL